MCGRQVIADQVPCNHFIFRKRNKMTLKSAFEDLTETTLHPISGMLGKLDYLSSLRGATGYYEHWGLGRVHGELAAQRALAEAHRSMLSGILRSPLQKLVEDLELSSQPKGITPAVYLQNLRLRTDLLPPEPGAASARHFNSVLHALSSLAQTHGGATHPIS